MKKNLFIAKNCIIHRNQKSLKIELDDSSNSIPLSMIENVFLIGNGIKLTNGARSLLLEHNKQISFYTSNYKLQGILSITKLQSNYRNRLFQYEAYKDETLKIAQYIVANKFTSMEKEFDLRLQKYTLKVYKAKKMDELLGIEGIASSYMFKKFRKYLQVVKIEDFKKREYHPSEDKVNGLLSFAYTLYSNLLYGLVLSDGYDPYIGFLHKKRGTHYAFVSDLIEFDRAKITMFVLKLFTLHSLEDEDFDGIYLTYDGRKKFLIHFNQFVSENFEISKQNLNVLGDQLV